MQHRESKSTHKTLLVLTSYGSFCHANMHSKNNTRSYPSLVYTFLQPFFLDPGFRIKTKHHSSVIYFPTSLREPCFVRTVFVLCSYMSVTLRFRFVEDSLISGIPSNTTRVSLTFGVLRVVFSSASECSSFISEFVVIFPAPMWKNRLLGLGRSGQRGVYLLILTSMSLSVAIFITLHLFYIFSPASSVI